MAALRFVSSGGQLPCHSGVKVWRRCLRSSQLRRGGVVTGGLHYYYQQCHGGCAGACQQHRGGVIDCNGLLFSATPWRFGYFGRNFRMKLRLIFKDLNRIKDSGIEYQGLERCQGFERESAGLGEKIKKLKERSRIQIKV